MRATIQNSMSSIKSQLKQNVIAITSLLVALIGLSANIYYMEQKELNSNLRTASFQLLIELSELEETTFHLQYDKELATINARTGWVKVRLVNALTALMPAKIQSQSKQLHQIWADNWQQLGAQDQKSSDKITQQIAELRESVIQFIGMIN